MSSWKTEVTRETQGRHRGRPGAAPVPGVHAGGWVQARLCRQVAAKG